MNATIEKAFRQVFDAMTDEEAVSIIYKELQREQLEPVLVTAQYHDAVCKFIAEHHLPREPTAVALGVTWTPDVESYYRDILRNDIPMMLVNTHSGDIAAVVIMRILKENNKKSSITHVKSNAFAKWLTFLQHKDGEINFFKRYSVTEGVHLMSAIIRESNQARGIGTIATTFLMLLALELGYKACMMQATNPVMQRILTMYGCDQLAVLKFEDYVVNGELVFKNMPPGYTSLITYGKKLPSLSLSKL